MALIKKPGTTKGIGPMRHRVMPELTRKERQPPALARASLRR